MPDKKLTDSEIIKALECCMDEMGCTKGCPCFDPKSKSSHCTAVGDNGLEKLALDLITHLKAENERLKEEKEILKSLLDSSQERYFEISNLCHKYRNKLETNKAEAYKKVFEKLKDKSIVCKVKLYGKGKFFPCLSAVALHDIKLLEKELVGDTDV